MITKETFVKTMERLQILDEKFDAVNNAMSRLSTDFCSFYIFEPFDITVDLLMEYFDDKEGWLPYFIWECNWLRDLKYGDVTVYDEPVDLSDWGKVYDFLMEEKN